MPESHIDEERLRQAEAFLQEAVYRSREARAAPLAAPSTRERACGLGERAAVDLDLSARALELERSLWPTPLSPTARPHVDTILAAWVERADAFDRKRNHFLKAFRQKHGFDRTRYSATDLAAYDSGLEAIHAEIRAGHRAAAHALLEISGS
jgi:hypothetical protein